MLTPTAILHLDQFVIFDNAVYPITKVILWSIRNATSHEEGTLYRKSLVDLTN